jgi:hypothetical protein
MLKEKMNFQQLAVSVVRTFNLAVESFTLRVKVGIYRLLQYTKSYGIGILQSKTTYIIICDR